METLLENQNTSFVKRIENTIRKNSIENDGQYLEIINKFIKWDDITDIVIQNIHKLSAKNLSTDNIKILVKCLVLKRILRLSDTELHYSLLLKNSYQNFIGAKSESDIPDIESISSFHEEMLTNRLFGKLIIKFTEHFSDSKLYILESIVNKDLEKPNLEILDKKNKEGISEHVKLEIQERLKILYETKIDSILSGLGKEKAKDFKENLSNVKSQIEKIIEDDNEKKSQDIQKLINIDQSLNNIYKIALNLEKDINEQKLYNGDKKKLNENTEIQLFNPFYKALDDYILDMNEDSLKNEVTSEILISDNLRSVDNMLKELLESINIDKDVTSFETEIVSTEIGQPPLPSEYIRPEEETNPDAQEFTEVGTKEYEIPGTDLPQVEIAKKEDQEPFILTPKFKKEGIFNDENLTEDYELGFRLHQLGLKIGFFNVKLDINSESSRISTAEFFPNTFWASVKQRSRWIAGICFQNWKANKWKGDLATKYFLFRDRKSLFSLLGAFFSNIIFIYLIVITLSGYFFDSRINPLVDNSSVLLYLIFINLFFMISRASHRFMFTYNWYGFKYAFFSFFRVILDTFINFFAIIRSVKVYKKTKQKVVWDSTDHY